MMTTIWSTDDVGQGPGALGWLVGDVNGDGKAEVVQPWNDGGSLGMIVYGWNGSAMTALWSANSVGTQSPAAGWAIGDVNGDGRAEVMQPSDSNGTLEITVYGWNGGMTQLGGAFVGPFQDAAAWLAGDVDGDGRAELVQPWNNGGSLAMDVYGWSPAGGMTPLGFAGLGQDPGATDWLIGDVNGDGKDEVVEPSSMTVYGWSNGAMVMLSSMYMQGSSGGPWLICDVNGDGRAEVVQLSDNGGSLGMTVYGWQPGGGMAMLSSNYDTGQGSGAVGWLTGDLDGDGKAEVVQLWGNSSGVPALFGGSATLGMNVYGWTGSEMATLWGSSDMGQGPGAQAWLMAALNGGNDAQVVQPWANGGSLGMNVYGWQGV
jgi:hypothetical protein